jgi:hypothetical protein
MCGNLLIRCDMRYLDYFSLLRHSQFLMDEV